MYEKSNAPAVDRLVVPGHPIRLEFLHCQPDGPRPSRGRPILFLHGAFCGAWVWAEHFMPWFAAHGRECWALSLRGHGGSDGAIRNAVIEDYVEDLEAAMDSFTAPPVIVAHSMGGYVAMRWLERPSAQAAALVLMGSVPHTGLGGPTLSMATFETELMAEISLLVGNPKDAAGPETLQRAMFSDHIDRRKLARYIKLARQESLAATLEMQVAQPIDAATLRAKQPCLVLGAQEDRLIPKAFVRATGRALGVSARILPDIGHAMMLDHYWEKSARIIDHWLGDQGL